MHELRQLDIGYAPVLLQLGENPDVDLVELHKNTRQMFEPRMAWQTASVTSRVVAVPPTSGVSMPSAVTASTARINRAAASSSPRCSSIWAAVQKVATGLAIPLPVISNAEPWMGSNIEG